MLTLTTLKSPRGTNKNTKRIGRGQGSGQGTQAGKGHKGQKARNGGGVRIGFEGGQMPLQRRVPKFGFKSFNRVEFKPVNLDTLQSLAEEFNLTSITLETLVAHGHSSKNDKIKVLGGGQLTTKLDVSAHQFSATAVAAIEALGGTVTKL